MPDPIQDRPYTTLERRYLWQSRWYDVRQDRLRDVNGGELLYTVIEKQGAVFVVPLTDDGRLVLIEQYRYAVDDWCLEVPAGHIEPGASPEEMAARELREEIGGTAAQLAFIADFYTMNGIGDEKALVYLARGVELGEPEREATEHIRLRVFPADEAVRLARTGAIKDGPSALAILLCEPALQTPPPGVAR
jgi:ADP-ribose pyrophosphatase